MENIKESVLFSAHTLFEHQLVTGSTGNISYKEGENIYISKSGSCFGTLSENDFVKINKDGSFSDGKPSKEYPLHLSLYNINKDNQAVIHTHSSNITYLSCVMNQNLVVDELFKYTPYLKMKSSGSIISVQFHAPGSKELFDDFQRHVSPECNVYILQNHGAVVAAKSMMDAYYLIAELEESAKLVSRIIENKGKLEFRSIGNYSELK